MITFICLIIIALFYLQLFGLHPDHWQSCLPGYCKLQLPEQRTGIKKDFILWGIADTIEQQDNMTYIYLGAKVLPTLMDILDIYLLQNC